MDQKYLKSLFHYDPDVGEFIRLVRKGRAAEIGTVAGSINKEGYRIIFIDWKPYKAHRLAWLYFYGELPEGFLDHINHIRSDNRISNLRIASLSENNKNQRMHRHNKSGFTGVYWNSVSKKWGAFITVNNKRISLGKFTMKDDAIKVREEANKKYGFHKNHGFPVGDSV